MHDGVARAAQAVDLFCGAGGLSYGMQRTGVRVNAGIDVDAACRHPFGSNVGAAFHELDVSVVSPEFVDSLFTGSGPRVLAGCVPCQPFSSYSNPSRSKKSEWQLLLKFGAIASAVLPDIVTMENVPQLREREVFERFLTILEDAHYSTTHAVVRCAEYGVPQTRRRLVLLASRLGPIDLEPPTRGDGRYDTARETIGHLEAISAGGASNDDPLHVSSGLSARNMERIRHSKPGGTWRDWSAKLRADCHLKESGRTFPGVYGRMQWDEPAPTITTQFNGYGNGRFGHPEQDRAISLREGALLQTFPEEYSFVPVGSPVRIAPLARLIGNAVPVRLGEAIGRSIVRHLRAAQ